MTALLLLLLAGSPGDAAAVLRSLEASGRSLKTMRAGFVQTRVLELLDETEESRGSVMLQVPGRLRWDYAQPQQSVMLVREGAVVRFIPRTREVFRGKAGKDVDLLVGFGPGAEGLGRKYDVTLAGEEAVAGVAAHVLDLKPKGEQASAALFSAIRLWVDKARHVPVQTRLTDPSGDQTTIRFEQVQLNVPLPAGAFELKLPRDAVEVK